MQPERLHFTPDFSISRVLTGLWQIADLERSGRDLDPDAAAASMAPYVEAGLTTFDMADHYGSAEIITGVYRKNHDADVQLLTKWVPPPGGLTPDDVRGAVEHALERMQGETIDLMQFHAWTWADPRWLDGLFYLRDLQAEGLIRYLGVTNFDTAHLNVALASGVPLLTNQVCFSLLDRRPLRAMTDLCLEKGVSLLCYGTLAGGLLTERWLGEKAPDVDSLETWSQMKYRRFIDAAGGWDAYQSLLETIRDIAERKEVSMANVACRWVLDQPAVAGVIIGARLGQSEHIEDNLRLFEFSLDQDDLEALDRAAEALDTIPGDCGDEYRKPPFLTASGDLSHHLESIPQAFEAKEDARGRLRVSSGTSWEKMAGYCRAVRQGDRICVAGTTATHSDENGDRVIGGEDPGAQFHFIIDKIEAALRALGGSLEDVVRTRVFIHDLDDWEPVARAHGVRFAEILPANTLVQAEIIGEENLVEVEAEAIVVGD